MSLIKYDTFFSDPFSEMDRLFSEFLGDRSRFTSRNQFPVDVYSDEHDLNVVAELPGFAKKDISIDLHNAVLSIKASRVRKENGQEHTYHYSRSITVGDDINASKVTAKYQDGVLTVNLPKREERKPKSIKIA